MTPRIRCESGAGYLIPAFRAPGPKLEPHFLSTREAFLGISPKTISSPTTIPSRLSYRAARSVVEEPAK